MHPSTVFSLQRWTDCIDLKTHAHAGAKKKKKKKQRLAPHTRDTQRARRSPLAAQKHHQCVYTADIQRALRRSVVRRACSFVRVRACTFVGPNVLCVCEWVNRFGMCARVCEGVYCASLVWTPARTYAGSARSDLRCVRCCCCCCWSCVWTTTSERPATRVVKCALHSGPWLICVLLVDQCTSSSLCVCVSSPFVCAPLRTLYRNCAGCC